jgi:hypothetical protein
MRFSNAVRSGVVSVLFAFSVTPTVSAAGGVLTPPKGWIKFDSRAGCSRLLLNPILKSRDLSQQVATVETLVYAPNLDCVRAQWTNADLSKGTVAFKYVTEVSCRQSELLVLKRQDLDAKGKVLKSSYGFRPDSPTVTWQVELRAKACELLIG